jgi:acylphosphatase
VGYRYWAQHTALRCGVSGWVRNEYDGTVTAHLEGSGEGCRKFIDACRQGPSSARVEDISLRKTAPEGCSRFSVRY